MSPNDHALYKAFQKMCDRFAEIIEEHPELATAELSAEADELDRLADIYEREHAEDMWVVVYNPETNEEYLRRTVGEHEHLDTLAIAQSIAEECDQLIAEPDGHIPNCCGDIRVEFRRDPDNDVCIWSGESFYFKREDE